MSTQSGAGDLPPLVDIHTHIGRLPGVVGEEFSAEDLAFVARREGARYVLASSASTSTVGQAYGTAEALAAVERYPGLVGGMLWVNPHDPGWRDSVPVASRRGFLGIKIHPVLDHYEVDRRALDEVFSCARARRWPILTHADRDETAMSSARYEPLLRAYPDVVLVLAHLRLEAILLAQRYENAFVDTTYVDPARVATGLSALGAEKILFGSDACEGFDVGHPVFRDRPPRSYAGLVRGMREAGIAEAALEAILHGNACRVFRLLREGG